MRFIALSIVSLILLSIECAVLRPLGLSVARADVGIAAILFFAVRCPTLGGALASASIGYFVDILSGQPSGLYIFSAVLTFLISKFIAPFVEIRSAIGFGVLVGAVDAFHNLAAYGLVVLGTHPGTSRGPMLYAIPLTAGLTTIAAIATWPILRRTDAIVRKPDTGLISMKRPRTMWRTRKNWG
jgi:hypothetical protein